MTCRHFGTCGGCATQDLAYDEEIARKEAALRELFGRDVPVVASPRELHYRTRMDFVYAWGKLGQRKKGDPMGVLDLDECLLVSPRAWEAVLRVKEAVRRLGLRSYEYNRHKGYLRYASVRVAPRLDQLMLVFLTNGPKPHVRALMDEAEEWADSVVWSVTERRADVSVGDVEECRKQDFVEERIGEITYRFGPNSFFQSNPWVTEMLYGHVAGHAAGETLDLFCGVGGLALFAAARGLPVTGIDSNAEAIGFARGNAERNGLDVRFESADAAKWLAGKRARTLILDPPRSGVGFKMLRHVLAAAPERIAYVACNPNKLALELPHFEGYQLQELKAFDLFPRTPHVEVVATLISSA